MRVLETMAIGHFQSLCLKEKEGGKGKDSKIKETRLTKL
jgi:hypothetical protein